MKRRRPISFEVNVNAVCNATCQDCNRAIGLAKFRHMDLTASQMRVFVDRLLADGVKVKRIGMLGGEPVLNKELQGIIDECHRLEPRRGEVLTNDMPRTKHLRDQITLPGPNWKWKRAPLDDPDDPKSGKAKHDAFFISPQDLGLTATFEECRVRHYCGRGIDPSGFSMCGVAGTLARLLRVEECYDPDHVVDHETPGICEHCVYGLPKAVQRDIYARAAAGELPRISETYQKAFALHAESPHEFPRVHDDGSAAPHRETTGREPELVQLSLENV